MRKLPSLVTPLAIGAVHIIIILSILSFSLLRGYVGLDTIALSGWCLYFVWYAFRDYHSTRIERIRIRQDNLIWWLTERPVEQPREPVDVRWLEAAVEWVDECYPGVASHSYETLEQMGDWLRQHFEAIDEENRIAIHRRLRAKRYYYRLLSELKQR